MNASLSTITVNGIEYTPVGTIPTGNRHIVVVDRGWIFAGDMTRENGRIYLSRVVWIFKWTGCGFAAVVEDPVAAKADIRPFNDIDIPEASEIYSIPVSENWGIQS